MIKNDIMQALDFFYHMHDHQFARLNTAHVVLVPKKADARCIGDFRPISLTHSIAKLFSKILASRLAPVLNSLVSRAQSAFIKRRSIQDNFMYTRNLIRALYRSKQHGLFMKLDIAKAFDSVWWDYLLEVLEHFGFGWKWREWITILLASSSTSILLNGSRGLWYKHHRGLRQGDPLSPILFILAMEPLQRIMELATRDGLLSPINHRAASLRTSLYADDATIFLKPIKEEIWVISELLRSFGDASGLNVNVSKSAVFPIRCDGLNLQDIMGGFSCQIKNFPCTYLGLPLHYKQLRRVDFQPLIDKMANRLPTWKGRFLNKAGRLKLLNTVLSSIPTYFLTAFALKKWLLKRLDKIRRGFLWKGLEEAKGGHCLVNWAKVKRPKVLGGLGVLDFELFSRALRQRWLWFQWEDPDRPWACMEVPCSEADKQLFRASTCVTVGNGVRAKFWESAWLDGRAPRDLAPNLYKMAWRKNQSVRDDLQNDNWTRGILRRLDTVDEIAEFITLASKVQSVQLNNSQGHIKWRWTANGVYSAKSAYKAQLFGAYYTFDAQAIWSARVEGKHRFFAWLMVQCKVLTADKLLKRNWPCDPLCPLCSQEPETADHLFLQCAYTKEVWFRVSQETDGLLPATTTQCSMEEWWNSSLERCDRNMKKKVASLMIYTACNIWRERNRRIFEAKSAMPMRVVTMIKDEARLCYQACGGEELFPFP